MQHKAILGATGESDALAGLSEEQRRLVDTAVSDNVLEGWDPTPADLGLLTDYAAGKMTAEQYRAAVIAAVWASPALPGHTADM